MKIIDKRLKETADIIDSKFLTVREQNRAEVSTDILRISGIFAKRLCTKCMTRNASKSQRAKEIISNGKFDCLLFEDGRELSERFH